jgi:hypothetical protein
MRLNCRLISTDIMAESNGQGRTANAADALQTSCDARLYLSKGPFTLYML